MAGNQRGFTLIELSMVITIIGLVMGAIVVGQSLIRAAQLRAVLDEYQRYTQAVSTFRDKYMALPGDFSGASALWGSVTGAVPNGGGTNGFTCFFDWLANPASFGTKTCDGDGDGQIEDRGPGGWYTNGYVFTYYETVMAWQHLANAGLIDGYQPPPVNAMTPSIGQGLPASRLSGGGWCIGTLTLYDTQTSHLPSVMLYVPYQTGDIPYNTYLLLFGMNGFATVAAVYIPCGYDLTQIPDDPILTTDEAQSIDQKIDDGLPETGKVVAVLGGSANAFSVSGYNGCYNSSTPAQYDMTQSGPQCSLIFKTGF